MYDEYLPPMVASNDMHAYNTLAICITGIGIYSYPIYEALCTRAYIDILRHYMALYLIHEELYRPYVKQSAFDDNNNNITTAAY